jgi:hypothetical protein
MSIFYIRQNEPHIRMYHGWWYVTYSMDCSFDRIAKAIKFANRKNFELNKLDLRYNERRHG